MNFADALIEATGRGCAITFSKDGAYMLCLVTDNEGRQYGVKYPFDLEFTAAIETGFIAWNREHIATNFDPRKKFPSVNLSDIPTPVNMPPNLGGEQ